MKISSRLFFFISIILLLKPSLSQALQINDRAPDFTLQKLSGNPLSLQSLKGKVVYINFWASWCNPCRHEFPALNNLAEKYKESGFVVLAVNQDRKKANVDDFLIEYPVSSSNMIILLDPKSSVITSYGPRAMPTSFILDKGGVVRYIHFGFSESDPPKWIKEIETLLKE